VSVRTVLISLYTANVSDRVALARVRN